MKIPQEILSLCRRVNEGRGKAYLVGGCVRDFFLGIQPKDHDILVVGLTVEELAQVFPEGSWVGKDFPVLMVGHTEIALARVERKIGPGYSGFACETENVTLEQDLIRRDLTMNAIAWDVAEERVIDPFNGVDAIKEGRLLPVSSAFCEDPLRVFRAARFAAQFDFYVSHEVEKFAIKVTHELPLLSAERVWQETEKALNSKAPHVFFEALFRMGALSHWFPELLALRFVPAGPVEHHPEGSAFVHTMHVLKEARRLGADNAEMFAALVHDLGKALTPAEVLPSHNGHEEAGLEPLAALCDRLKVPKRHRQLAELVVEHHLRVHRVFELRAAKQHDLVRKLRHFRSSVGLVCEADVRGRPPKVVDAYPSRQRLEVVAETIASVKADPEWGEGEIVGIRLRQARISAIKRLQ